MDSSSQGVSLSVTSVSKQFDERYALLDCSLSANPGEFVVIVGKSGSGKSTLLRLLAGLDKPTAGRIVQDELPLKGLNRLARVMFQDPRLLPWKRVLANVTLGLNDAGKQRGRELLAKVGLGDRERDWPTILSGGQKQRVALARALASRPKLLLLDEPLGALDALTRYEMQSLIEELWLEQKVTAVLVTHDPEEAALLGDRVIVLDEGKVESIIDVNLSRPRDRDSLALRTVRQEILSHLLGTAKSQIQAEQFSEPKLGFDSEIPAGFDLA